MVGMAMEEEEKRKKRVLPINQYEGPILDAIANNTVVVIIGDTGSGKTTQLAQILYRAGYTSNGIVAVTQPRRVAAVSVARRVAYEMGVQLGDEVGYSIRFEDRTSSKTCIKYLTDGCLLRECLFDYKFQQYSVIILDEAHERSLNTDILLGLLKRVAAERKPELKVIVTSATLDGQKFSEYFFNCPVVTVPGKLYPVQLLYSVDQPRVGQVLWVKRDKDSSSTAGGYGADIHVREPPGDILLFMTGQEEILKAISMLEERVKALEEGSCLDVEILPLYASLPPESQARVFLAPPSNCRRIIVATNLAETSLTVDGVVYVIDPGHVKQRQYDPATGIDSLTVVPISRVQAMQRAGRAGRTRAGKCYRLYPLSTYEHELLATTVPEIQRSSLTGAVLHLKSLDLPNLDILRFDFIDQPSMESLEDALRQLFVIDAIHSDGTITALGKHMAELPLEPALARALLAAQELGCLSQALTVAGMLSCESIFFQAPRRGQGKKREREEGLLPSGGGYGDHIQYLQIYEAWQHHNFDVEWCKSHGLQGRSMRFAKDVRHQLAVIIMKKNPGGFEESAMNKSKEKVSSTRSLRKALCQGFANRLAQRMPRHNGYHIVSHRSQLVQIHPSASTLKVDEEGLYPEWVLYHELVASPRPYLRHVCVVEASWVAPALSKLQNVNISSLSGQGARRASSNMDAVQAGGVVINIEKILSSGGNEGSHVEIEAARARFLARKQSKTIKL